MSVKLDDPGLMLWHSEPVLAGDEHLGEVTSGAYGHSLGAAVGLAWVHGIPSGTPASVVVRGTRVPATLSREPF